jgi:V/A-type H+-transporting ATPase subunit C
MGSANALCTKAQAMYGQRVLPEEYRELCQKQSLSDVVAYLQKHPRYQEIFADVKPHAIHRQQVEELLEKNYFMQCGKLIRYAPKEQQPFYVHEIMFLEITIIIDKVMHLSTSEDMAFTMPVTDYIAKKMSFDIYGLIPINSFDELKQYLRNTKYETIIKDFDFTDAIDFNALEKQLTHLYFDKYIRIIKQRFNGKIQAQLIDVLLTSMELQNITRLYRLKKYFRVTPEELENASFLKYKRMSNRLLEQLIQAKDLKSFMQLLADSRYHMDIQETEMVYIEHDIEAVEGRLAKKSMRFSREGALVYLAYCTLQRTEINNLKHIIEGIRYHKSATSIEEMVIYA